ncbi:hypothetical protein ACOSP7_004526 [Xanthoceras sorbifolium]
MSVLVQPSSDACCVIKMRTWQSSNNFTTPTLSKHIKQSSTFSSFNGTGTALTSSNDSPSNYCCTNPLSKYSPSNIIESSKNCNHLISSIVIYMWIGSNVRIQFVGSFLINRTVCKTKSTKC